MQARLPVEAAVTVPPAGVVGDGDPGAGSPEPRCGLWSWTCPESHRWGCGVPEAALDQLPADGRGHCDLVTLCPRLSAPDCQPAGAEKPQPPTLGEGQPPAQCLPGGGGTGEGVPQAPVGLCCVARALPDTYAAFGGAVVCGTLEGGTETRLPGWDCALESRGHNGGESKLGGNLGAWGLPSQGPVPDSE